MSDLVLATRVERDRLTGLWSVEDEKYENRFRGFMEAISESVFAQDKILAAKPAGLVLPQGINEEELRQRVVGKFHIRALSVELMRTLLREDTAIFTPVTWGEQTIQQMDVDDFDRMSARTLSDVDRTMPIAALAGAHFILNNCQDGELDFALNDDVVHVAIK